MCGKCSTEAPHLRNTAALEGDYQQTFLAFAQEGDIIFVILDRNLTFSILIRGLYLPKTVCYTNILEKAVLNKASDASVQRHVEMSATVENCLPKIPPLVYTLSWLLVNFPMAALLTTLINLTARGWDHFYSAYFLQHLARASIKRTIHSRTEPT